MNTGKAAVAEFFGTFWLVFGGAGRRGARRVASATTASGGSASRSAFGLTV